MDENSFGNNKMRTQSPSPTPLEKNHGSWSVNTKK